MLGAKLVLCCLLAVALAEEAILRTPEQVHEYMEALIKSREDDGLTLEERMALNPNGTVLENSGRYQGDILLSDEQIEDMVAYHSGSRMAYIRPNRRWPNRIVPYQFLQNEFTQAQQRHIISVMDTIMRRTCVRFRLRTSSDRQFMTITGRATGCYAHLGFNPSRTAHNMNVARNTIGQGCLNAIVIAHEFYHILGFSHMHQSPPRDSYIRVLWDNIMDRYRFAFNRDPAQHFDMQRLPYEYGSMMHYGLFSASRNGRPTMQVLRQHTGTVGSLRQISGWDILRLQRHYNCPGAWSDEALNKARFTAYVPNEDDEIVETTVPEQPLADELEPAY